MKQIFSYIFILLISSCSLFKTLKEFENKDLGYDLPKRNEKVICPVKKVSNLKYYGTNEKLNIEYDKFAKKFKLNFLEASFLYSYLQVFNRPETISNNSRIYLLLKNKENVKSIMFIPTLGANTLSEAFDEFLPRSSQKRLIKLFWNKFKSSIPIDENFQAFLDANKMKLYKIKELRSLYFKGNQLIKFGESLPLRYKNIWDNSKIESQKIPFKFSTNQKANCSFDMSLFDKESPILERVNNKILSNIFGYFKKKDQFFLMVSANHANIETIGSRSIQNPHFKEINTLNTALCYKSESNSIIISSKSIHSEQILANILGQREFPSLPDEIINFINHSRNLKLLYPERVIHEVYASQKGKSNDLLFVPTIGRVDIIHSHNDSIDQYLDPRTSSLVCK